MAPPAAASRSPRLAVLFGRTLSAGLSGLNPRYRVSAAGPIRSMNVQAATQARKLKTIDDLPGPSSSRTLYWLFMKGYADKSHLLQGLQRGFYGPIWRSRIGPYDLVNVASPEFISQVIQQEGRYPVRAELAHWKDYLDLRRRAYGLHVSTGTDWYRIRSALNPKMLKLREVSVFAPVINQVVGDLLSRVQLLRKRGPDQATVSDITAELYKFGFEGISSILFETRLGCLQEEIPEDTLRFIGAVGRMMTLSEIVVVFPRWSRGILPFWRRFVEAWDDLYDVAQKLIDARVAQIEGQVCSGASVEGLYLTHLLSSGRLSRAEVYISVTELLLGGVDTTSNTLSWALYHLARDRRVQDLLYEEANAVCPGRREPTTDDLSRMPYLKAIIKETLRLYPVVPGNGRFVSDSDVVVGDYWFPRKTQFHLCHYAACHDEEEFVDAELFIPERWLRAAGPGPGHYQHHPYSFVPFGVGVRACVGKRLAEMEMYFALCRLMQNYQVQVEDGAPVVAPKTRILLIPSQPINLRFLQRA
ncbi:sterol 26-hydroxylase, mitochondrial [Brachionichthys hirsutus]|uniref:sterol 26-hydroxylase, mitochondrial n=1 Tax=Brachionichthys hirsutus TaxID=412623 RepID=UPI003604564B